MIEIKQKSKIVLHWKVSPYDYSKEKSITIQNQLSKKYGLPKDRIKVVPEFIIIDDNGENIDLTSEVIQNIQEPEFQVKLFKDWLSINKIEDYDFELIKKIDAEINGKIDYQVYDKFHRYNIKWIRWDNFLSYGADNYFDFTNIGTLALLSSNPSNQGGKTTFCVDLIRFLLFGNITRYKTQDKYFNKHLDEATNVVVEGCINIDDNDYIIKRTLSRPSLSKRTSKSKTTQKVEYFKIVGGEREALDEYDIDNLQDENSRETNKIIKESIGNESDFDLIMSITDSSLDELVKKKDAERGRLLSRWIGLLPLEEKDSLAREKYNSDVKPYLLSNQYNEGELSQEIEAFTIADKNLENDNAKLAKENSAISKEVETLEKNKTALLSSKGAIDNSLLNIDITTLNRKIEDEIRDGQKKNIEIEELVKNLKEIGDVSFSVEEYDKVYEELSKSKNKIAVIAEKYKNITKNIAHLKSSEICPTCGRKLDNVDNSSKIKELENELLKIEEEGKKERLILTRLTNNLEVLKKNRDFYNRKSQLEMKKAALELNVEKLRNEYKENISIKKEYEKNSKAIDRNNEIDIQIRNNDVLIRDKRNTREINLGIISRNEESLKNHKEQIEKRKEVIKKIKQETILLKNWKIYLDLVGKNGISKMVLRKTLPIINAKLVQLLSDVCDFDVEVGINLRNDVMFYLIKDGVKSDLQGASGFELTAAALALRAVLGDVSMIPKNSVLVVDEILGRVSKDNFENMRRLIEKISKSYKNVIIISHNEEIATWCDTHIVVKKENNISTISKLR
jgi:DNA repair exonuclease SbcCD ATPase subunit